MQKNDSPTIATSSSSPCFNNMVPYIALVGGFGLAFCQWMIFSFAPIEEVMGLSQKIFYMHLPLAWWGLISFFVVFCASLAFLRTGNSKWDILAGAGAEVGLLCASLALIAGSFWGKSSWGVWWIWDPKLSTTLIMCFVYAGYLIVRHMDMPAARRAKVSAVIGILAFLDVPIVYLSARMWRSIHPKSVGLDPDMKITLYVCVGLFFFFWLALFYFRYMIAMTENKLDALTTLHVMQQD